MARASSGLSSKNILLHKCLNINLTRGGLVRDHTLRLREPPVRFPVQPRRAKSHISPLQSNSNGRNLCIIKTAVWHSVYLHTQGEAANDPPGTTHYDCRILMKGMKAFSLCAPPTCTNNTFSLQPVSGAPLEYGEEAGA